MKEIILNGITISVTKKSIKNMYIRVVAPEGRVCISAPYSVSDDRIREFALSRMPWIKKHKSFFEKKSGEKERRYITGEKIYVWGQSYSLEVRHTNTRGQVYFSDGVIVLQVREDTTTEQREHILNEWYRREMKQVIPAMLRRCEAVVGVQAAEWRIKNMRTRWGTCNIQKKRIWLNLQLAQRAPECLEYVIMHELVHLLERYHNRRFYEYMDSFYPNWRKVKRELNQPMGE